MKKVLAIVLSIAVIFSFATVALAKEIKAGDVWFGPKDYKILANPGEEATFVVEFKSNLDDDQKAMFDEETFGKGEIIIPFNVMANDATMSPIQGAELTEAAKAAGATLTIDKDYEYYGLMDENVDDIWCLGTVTLPASYLYSGEALDVLNVKVKVSEDWIKDEYTGFAETPIDISFYVGGQALSETFEPAKVVIKNADGDVENEAYIDCMTDYGQASLQIQGKPYEPTKKEKRTEWWRKLAVAILEFNNKIINWLINDLFAPAPWNW